MLPRTDRLRFLQLGAIFALIALLLLPAAVALGPGWQPLPDRLAGAFVGWGKAGREHTLRDWEIWLSRRPSSVVAVDFYAAESWDQLAALSWLPGFWKRLNPSRRLVWSLPLTVPGTKLSEVAAGRRDAEFEAAARAIAAAQPSAVIRLGWEMNLKQMAWFSGGQEADFIAAFRRVVAIFRSHSGEFRFDWCPGWGSQDALAELAYPGDDVVDYVGLDVYDFKYEGPPEQRWEEFYLKAPFGLEWQRDFAKRHRKQMSYPEWGVGQFGDNQLFIERMHAWFVQNAADIAYAAYFNVNGDWPTQIDNDQFPQSREVFRRLFAGRS